MDSLTILGAGAVLAIAILAIPELRFSKRRSSHKSFPSPIDWDRGTPVEIPAEITAHAEQPTRIIPEPQQIPKAPLLVKTPSHDHIDITSVVWNGWDATILFRARRNAKSLHIHWQFLAEDGTLLACADEPCRWVGGPEDIAIGETAQVVLAGKIWPCKHAAAIRFWITGYSF